MRIICLTLSMFSILLMLPGTAAAQPSFSDPLKGYDWMLKGHVSPRGFVDYDALAADRAALDTYIKSLAAPGLLEENHPRDQRLATLINAYNAFHLKLILDNYGKFESGEVTSIKELHGGKPWDQKIWNLAGQTVSLNQIEHEMIRPDFDEPRIHWALVCAAYSCPPLRAEAYTAFKLETQLAEQEEAVLLEEDPRFLQVDGQQAKVTPLFDWYGQDFGDWKDYLNQRLPDAPLQYVGFLDYDWKLNSYANRPK